MTAPPLFTQYVAIDWSGAKGSRHKGIAVALCEVGDTPPRLIPPPTGVWSRQQVADWLIATAAQAPTLFGFDFSFAPPLVARGSYLPGDPTPDNGPAFWAYVDRCAPDEDLGAASFLEHVHRRHFYFGKADGEKARFMHLRVCEAWYNAHGGGKPSTVYDAIGAAQVAKASFAGMRLLHHVHAAVPIWPFDPLPASRSLIVEIYTSIAARAAGRPKGRTKIRDGGTLDAALAEVGSQVHSQLSRYDDHSTDALLTAAWLRHVSTDTRLWHPAPLTTQIARCEGWTFGVT